MSWGRRLKSRLIGKRITRTSSPIVQQAARQPAASITVWSQGKITIDPTPTPEKARLIAKPRRRTNQ